MSWSTCSYTLVIMLVIRWFEDYNDRGEVDKKFLDVCEM